MLRIILQIDPRVITESGAVSAEWVMAGVTLVAFFLFWRMLNRIERNLEKVIESMSVQRIDIELLKQTDKRLDEQIQELKFSR